MHERKFQHPASGEQVKLFYFPKTGTVQRTGRIGADGDIFPHTLYIGGDLYEARKAWAEYQRGLLAAGFEVVA